MFLIFILGFVIGLLVACCLINLDSEAKDILIEDYKKGIDIHNKRELRLIFINQSTKDYVRQQLDILKKNQNYKTQEYGNYAAARYAAFKEVEITINHLEKNSQDFNV